MFCASQSRALKPIRRLAIPCQPANPAAQPTSLPSQPATWEGVFLSKEIEEKGETHLFSAAFKSIVFCVFVAYEQVRVFAKNTTKLKFRCEGDAFVKLLGL